MFRTFSLICVILQMLHFANAGSGAEVPCPWNDDENVQEELKNGCVCAKNPPSSSQLSVQCHEVDGHQLVALLSETMSKQGTSIGLLYLNASLITDENGEVQENTFQKLRLVIKHS